VEIFLPTLEAKMTALVLAFRFIVFAIMVAGLIAYMAGSRAQGMDVITPILRAIVIVAALAYMDQWFPSVEAGFMGVANYIDAGYTANPTSSADTIRESTTANPEGQTWSWRHLNESIYQAVTHAIANIFICIGTLITVPMLILQYILRWLLYLITPFALAMFMVPGFSAIGVRFFQQMLAVMAWPVGFALTNLVALAVWTDFRAGVGAAPQTVTDAVVYSPLLTLIGGIVATIVIIVGMVSTPVVMQMLFAQGHGFTGASANPVSMVRSAASSIRGAGSGLFGGRSASLASSASATRPPTPPPSPMGADARPGI
jgi:hypothetical protein